MADVKQYTMVNLQTLTADGKEDAILYKSEAQAEKIKTEAAKVGTEVVQTRAVTFGLTQATSWNEFAVLVPDEAVRLDMANYGLALAQHTVKKDLMEDPEWEGAEGVFDLLPHVQVQKEKRTADPRATARRALRKVWADTHPGQEAPSDEEINRVLEAFANAGVAG